jgi:8-oxo-dGTP diphosphatase
VNYIEGVSAALVKGDKILVVRRSFDDDFLAGYYEMPGGRIEHDESHEEALIRELKEELSLKVKVVKKYHQFSYQPGPNNHCTDYQYLVTLAEREDIKNLKLSAEHYKYKWVNEPDLNNLSPMTEEAKESLKLAFKEQNGEGS